MLRKTLFILSVAKYYSLQASNSLIDSFLNFFSKIKTSNQSLEKNMKGKNVKPLNFHLQREFIIFRNNEDARSSKQIAEELSVHDHVVEVAFFLPGGRGKSKYRLAFKHNGNFFACNFYIQSVWLFLSVQLSCFHFSFSTKWTSEQLSLIVLPMNEKLMLRTAQTLAI